jgi:tRNA-specific 2-thiouridylase
VRLEAKARRVIVGPQSALATTSFALRDCNWLDDAFLQDGREVTVKLRSMHAGAPAMVRAMENGRAMVTLLAPQSAVSPGQACVAYDGERVLGGGWIGGRP